MRFSYYYQVYLHFIPGSRGSHPDLGPSRDRHRPDAHRRCGFHLRSDRPDCQGLRHGLLGLPDRLCDPDADHRHLQDFESRQISCFRYPPAGGGGIPVIGSFGFPGLANKLHNYGNIPRLRRGILVYRYLQDFESRQVSFRNNQYLPPTAGDTFLLTSAGPPGPASKKQHIKNPPPCGGGKFLCARDQAWPASLLYLA